MNNWDTDNAADFADTLHHVVGSALVAGAAAHQALLDARKAFDANDIDQARLIVNNATAPTVGDEPFSIQWAIYQSLPRGGERTEGMG